MAGQDQKRKALRRYQTTPPCQTTSANRLSACSATGFAVRRAAKGGPARAICRLARTLLRDSQTGRRLGLSLRGRRAVSGATPSLQAPILAGRRLGGRGAGVILHALHHRGIERRQGARLCWIGETRCEAGLVVAPLGRRGGEASPRILRLAKVAAWAVSPFRFRAEGNQRKGARRLTQTLWSIGIAPVLAVGEGLASGRRVRDCPQAASS